MFPPFWPSDMHLVCPGGGTQSPAVTSLPRVETVFFYFTLLNAEVRDQCPMDKPYCKPTQLLCNAADVGRSFRIMHLLSQGALSAEASPQRMHCCLTSLPDSTFLDKLAEMADKSLKLLPLSPMSPTSTLQNLTAEIKSPHSDMSHLEKLVQKLSCTCSSSNRMLSSHCSPTTTSPFPAADTLCWFHSTPRTVVLLLLVPKCLLNLIMTELMDCKQ